MNGKLQAFNGETSVYFVLVEHGKDYIMCPIDKWYEFTKRNIKLSQDKNIESIDMKLKTSKIVESEEAREIDFDEMFDDDEDNDKVIKIQKDRQIDVNEEKISNLVKELSQNPEQKIITEKEEPEAVDDVKKTKVGLTEKQLTTIFGKNKITIKDLIKIVKKDFEINENEKKIIKEFLQTRCKVETEPKTNNKLFSLK
ncbi:hypothetical protein A0H76_2520 [Hepatospora eriocheir]|uniref:Transcription initiation factor IIF subunit alpha n=1 Tax=Hepatospora eriocheir TaxID=1081669 RepID=A0A1X0QFJ7_9MICR|nr:hypothetical protein A0H76_2520 [Hepatospora eriocheir]